MICELEKTQQQLALDGVVESPDPQPRLQPQAGILQTREYLRNYHREWSKANKDKIREYSIRSRQRNAESIRAKRNTPEHRAIAIARAKEWRSDPKNRERQKESMRVWRHNHPEWFEERKKSPTHIARRRELYQINRDHRRAQARAYAKKPETRARCRAYFRRRRRESVQFALMDSLRATMNRAFRRVWIKKPARTEALIGCTIAEAKAHIESQFQSGMSWGNRRSFVIDHWVPVAAFNLEDPEEAHLCFNWRNLRPITQHDNAVKSSTLPSSLPSWLPPHIADRLLRRMTK